MPICSVSHKIYDTIANDDPRTNRRLNGQGKDISDSQNTDRRTTDTE